MNDFIIIAFRTFFLYFVILIIFKLMGKREVGELSVMDLVIFILIADVASFAVDNPKRSLFESILPMIILLVIQVTISFISLKSKKVRDKIDGDPTIIIRDGVLLEKEMKRQRYNLDDLFQQLREKDIGSVQKIAYAFLEPSGNLSVFMKDNLPPILPLIVDGEIQKRHLLLIKKSERWLRSELSKIGHDDHSKIFYCCFEDGKIHVQLKS
ncbi:MULTISPECIES: DUF421 domain-containing protein [unclassified Rummeliibacillus]|uniref:DUF421 domain-containing protein n=1 Tax=unclassified Rummeliibacillus TaxID=2622809 RepID=UPI000E668C19|nr:MULTISPECIES: DUF421 domain-containing protein [unclassified Rummeliibacillus]RIJ64179.1 DUF421 domain-containing protein [Rummeliibacillus sp. POC4]RPJ97379.1 DUF421 domain-containing protein [Rummeliibacillus sp. TYF005]